MWRKILLSLLLTNALLFASFNIYRLYPEYLFSQGSVSALELIPWEWEYQLFMGTRMAERREFVRAAGHYQLVLRYHPFLFPAAINLAFTHATVGNLDQAETIFWQVLAVDPGNSDAIWGLQRLRHLRAKMGG